MATATAEKEAVKEETEKERADRELKERVAKEGPSPLLVPAPESATDKLRKEGVEVVETPTAGLPGGGPANVHGMSAGGPTPRVEDVQKVLDETAKVRKEEAEKQKKEDEKAAKEAEKSAAAEKK